MSKNHTDGFARGVIYAAARMVEIHDMPTVAIDVLNSAGFSDNDYRQAAEYDLRILRKHLPGLPSGYDALAYPRCAQRRLR